VERAKRVITITLLRWRALLGELQRRGQKHRESGAFLLGTPTRAGQTARIKHFGFYDDLDPESLNHGGVNFHAVGYSRLWQLCEQIGMEVVADVHTHPGGTVAQSWIDAQHAMLPNVGHIALILPNFGYTSAWSMKGAGIYEYLGDHHWRTCNADGAARVRLCII